MEKTDLKAPGYWESGGCDLRVNPRLGLDTAGLREFLLADCGGRGITVFATSGTTAAGPKFVVLRREAILASAKMVNQHLGAGADDRWLCALPTFHVGGAGVWARARLSGSAVFGLDGARWDRSGTAFAEACRNHGITLTALTPTHLHDVVTGGRRCPPSLRALLIGGAALERRLRDAAVALGWPVLRTYGMTETASQVATEAPDAARLRERDDWLPVLDGWEVRSGASGRLEVKGAALFSGYAVRDGGGWSFENPAPGSGAGWFTGGDAVELREDGERTWLRFGGRADDRVKRLGELVSLDRLSRVLGDCVSGAAGKAVVVALDDERAGVRLVGVMEGDEAEDGETVLAAFNERVAPFERLGEVRVVRALPRTALGKIATGALRERLEED